MTRARGAMVLLALALLALPAAARPAREVQGNEQFAHGNYKLARAFYREALRDEPRSDRLWAKYHLTYLREMASESTVQAAATVALATAVLSGIGPASASALAPVPASSMAMAPATARPQRNLLVSRTRWTPARARRLSDHKPIIFKPVKLVDPAGVLFPGASGEFDAEFPVINSPVAGYRLYALQP